MFRHLFVDAARDLKRYRAFKHHWSEQRQPVVLEVDYSCLWQRDPTTNSRIACYFYKDIELIAVVSDYPGALCIGHGGSGRLHLFASESRDEIIREILQSSKNNVGIELKPRKDPLTFETFQTNRLGKYSSEEAITSLSEFNVQKISERHPSVSFFLLPSRMHAEKHNKIVSAIFVSAQHTGPGKANIRPQRVLLHRT